MEPFEHFATDAVHAGQAPDPTTGAVVVPLCLSTTFAQEAPAQHKGYEYSRSGNPTRAAYEACLARLESAQHGIAFASGLAATQTILLLLPSGSHVVCMDDVYGGTNRLLSRVAAPLGIETSFVDASAAPALAAALRPNTRLVWLESPTNPMLRLVDLAAAAAVVHAQPNVLLAVDNTFMSPYFQRPLDLGADLVMHSITKVRARGGAARPRRRGRL